MAFKPNKSISRLEGTQDLYDFENGYGASVICTEYSYGGRQGLYELAVLSFKDNPNGAICYTTPITDDVIGYLTPDDVQKYLQQIADL